MIELEKTYLVKSFPEGLKNCEYNEVIDLYLPSTSYHPELRIRKIGDSYEMTKKQPVKKEDRSNQEEQTIILSQEEYEALISQVKGKRVHKIRYYYDYMGNLAEFGIFQGPLEGLVLVDFEFKSVEEKDSFEKPDFCLADVTQELFTAGGMICGKKYEDIEGKLKEYGYEKLYLK